MDAGIADTINRGTVRLVALFLDDIDAKISVGMILPADLQPWYLSPLARTLMGENGTSDSDRAWLCGQIITHRVPGILDWDGPADEDWENLLANFRAEILARRDPEAHSARTAEIPVPDGVGSQ